MHEYVGGQSRLAQSVYCLAMGWMTGRSRFDPRQRRKEYCTSLCVQIGCGAHPASCPVGTVSPFPGAEVQPERGTDHSPPSSVEVENE
jgi:hypothetical protein